MALFLLLIWISASAAAEPEVLLVHTGSVLGSLRDLFESGSGSDLTLRVQTSDRDQVEILQVHALVLTIHSPVFGHMIQSRKSPVLELTESPEAVAVFGKFIRYLYSGVLVLHQEEALSLHTLSCQFDVSSLRRGLEEHMLRVLDSDWPGALVTSWLEYAVRTGQVWLRERCVSALALNLRTLLQGGGLARLSTDLVLDLVSRSDLVLDSELDLFHAVQTWIQTKDPDGLTAETALRHVRYAMIPPQDLFQIQAQSPVLQRYQDSVRDLLLLSFQFHSGSPRSTGGRYLDLSCSLFIPRVYLGPDWGQSWTITGVGRDQQGLSLQTQLGPSGSDRFRRVQWSVRWSLSSPAHISVTPAAAAPELSSPAHISVTPAAAAPELSSPAHISVTPAAAAPELSSPAHISVTPAAAAPELSSPAHISVTPAAAAPELSSPAHISVTPAAAAPELSSPAHISVTPAAAAPELSGIVFHKSLLLVGAGNCSLRLCHFHHSSSESPDCLKTQDQDQDQDQILVHLVIRPVYHGLN